MLGNPQKIFFLGSGQAVLKEQRAENVGQGIADNRHYRACHKNACNDGGEALFKAHFDGVCNERARPGAGSRQGDPNEDDKPPELPFFGFFGILFGFSVEPIKKFLENFESSEEGENFIEE